ncbi:Lrp/AsnC family transcriptional regulator [Jatrophihabitans telluris]|uniref:Lrp/AsnC family transcriptional regulator n=1 Tax=Jatrophihabitans telluris TaxID=2038343 RepID=A0ABY4R2V1_9ACTN|nr:Lrp/AsnC family transcriptional regulator [Jatrophihabitans telluris]UQX90155.1 Lrp/AsnC family transcriptional regulator [Jatrophihabitans telluris]
MTSQSPVPRPHLTRIPLDEIDHQLIGLLQRDGRASYAELAPAVGLSPPAVRQRVQRLVEGNVVQIVAVTDPLALGLPVMALVGVKVSGDAMAVADALGAIQRVIYVVITGGAYDLFAEIVCEDMAELFDIINTQLRPMDGVASVESFPYFDIHTHRFTWDTSTD